MRVANSQAARNRLADQFRQRHIDRQLRKALNQVKANVLS
jgi:hypothetical protein